MHLAKGKDKLFLKTLVYHLFTVFVNQLKIVMSDKDEWLVIEVQNWFNRGTELVY